MFRYTDEASSYVSNSYVSNSAVEASRVGSERAKGAPEEGEKEEARDEEPAPKPTPAKASSAKWDDDDASSVSSPRKPSNGSLLSPRWEEHGDDVGSGISKARSASKHGLSIDDDSMLPKQNIRPT